MGTKAKSTSVSFDLIEDIFNGIIKRGNIEREKEIIEGFKIAVRPLDSKEMLEGHLIGDQRMVPPDVSASLRIISILSRAITKVNGIEIPKLPADIKVGMDSDTALSEDAPVGDKEALKARRGLKASLTKLPTYIINDAYDFYEEVVAVQRELLNPKKKTEDGEESEDIGDKIKAF